MNSLEIIKAELERVTNEVPKYSEAKLILEAEAIIENLVDALSVAVDGLQDHDCRLGSKYFDVEERFVDYCAKCDSLKNIAEILSGGGEKK